MTDLIFISSPQREFAAERQALKNFILGNSLLSRYFDVFLFEDAPARDQRPDHVYLRNVESCSVFLTLLGREYGSEDPAGISPTEREFDHATDHRKPRLVFVKDVGRQRRHMKTKALIAKIQREVVYRPFATLLDLQNFVYDSLLGLLESCGVIRHSAFDASPCAGASINSIDAGNVARFIQLARRERGLQFSDQAPLSETLAHLNLWSHDRPSNAAVLLFGRDPQRLIPSASIKCVHFHGIEVSKPLLSHQLIDGTLLTQIDTAVDFVMTRLNRSVGARTASNTAHTKFEIPRAAVAECIVNAIAHRDYASNSAVQVMLFADRLEIWSPGRLPAGFTAESLSRPHSSEPRNPLIARPLYLANYVEQIGSGTLDVIRHCRAAGLPAPDFTQRDNHLIVTLWRDWLHTPLPSAKPLNPRQTAAIVEIRRLGRLTNAAYQSVTGSSRPTAIRDLADLVASGVFTRIGTRRGAHYVLNKSARDPQSAAAEMNQQ